MSPNANSVAALEASARAQALGDRIGPACFRLGVTALWAYACSLFPFGRMFGGRATLGALAIFIAGCVFILIAPRSRTLRRWLPTTRLLGIGMASLALSLVLLAADVLFTVRDNWARSKSERLIASDARVADSTVWHGELYPRMYRPAGTSFFLYKPNVRLTGETYGERYVPAMLASPTLKESVLERRRLSVLHRARWSARARTAGQEPYLRARRLIRIRLCHRRGQDLARPSGRLARRARLQPRGLRHRAEASARPAEVHVEDPW